jgi:hypothetical protein
MKQKYIGYCTIAAVLVLGQRAAAQQYCTPPMGPTCESDKITNVDFAGINNPSGCTDSGYSNYTALTPGEVTAGNTYTLSVSTEFGMTAVGVWIDYNQDKNFSASEFTDLGSADEPNSTLSAAITIPADVIGGYTRMRVKCQLLAAVSENSSCSLPAWNNGETEDYTIAVTPATASVDDPSMQNFYIYPNPATDFITIGLLQGKKIDGISVYSVSGQLLLSSGDPANEVDVHGLAQGTYILKLLTEQGNSIIKFIKL